MGRSAKGAPKKQWLHVGGEFFYGCSLQETYEVDWDELRGPGTSYAMRVDARQLQMVQDVPNNEAHQDLATETV